MPKLVDIECAVVRRNQNSIVIRDGRTVNVPGANGEVIEREIETILPIAHIEENDDGTITMPEWLAVDRGLV